jgi:hypothetical protein
MRDHVTFLSDAFNKTEVKDNFINDDCFGEDLAEWLISCLSLPAGFVVDPEPCQEDWGWEVLLSGNGEKIFVGIGQYEIDDQLGWMCFVKSEVPFYKSWFGVRSDVARRSICAALHHALHTNQRITQIRWHHEQDFMKGNESNWTERPDAEQSDARESPVGRHFKS